MTNTTLLKAKIDASGYKMKYIANRIGLSYQGLLNKIRNKTDFTPLFPEGLPFFGMKQVNFLDKNNDQNYYFAAPLPSARFGAWL